MGTFKAKTVHTVSSVRPAVTVRALEPTPLNYGRLHLLQSQVKRLKGRLTQVQLRKRRAKKKVTGGVRSRRRSTNAEAMRDMLRKKARRMATRSEKVVGFIVDPKAMRQKVRPVDT